MQSIKNLLSQYCLTIDNKGTKAMDDAISVESLESKDGKKLWKVHIHITDITNLVTPNSKIDEEAKIRTRSQYIGKYFFKAMLPPVIYQDVGSLSIKKKDKQKMQKCFTFSCIVDEEFNLQAMNDDSTH
jgi:exoribonuclease R